MNAPPKFLALKCAQCNQFCVQQTTKNRKWACRLCGLKQSITKVFAGGDKAADVRVVVQQLATAAGSLRLAGSSAAADAADFGDDGGFAAASAEDDEEGTAAAGAAWGEFDDGSVVPPSPEAAFASASAAAASASRGGAASRGGGPSRGRGAAAGAAVQSGRVRPRAEYERDSGRADDFGAIGTTADEYRTAAGAGRGASGGAASGGVARGGARPAGGVQQHRPQAASAATWHHDSLDGTPGSRVGVAAKRARTDADAVAEARWGDTSASRSSSGTGYGSYGPYAAPAAPLPSYATTRALGHGSDTVASPGSSDVHRSRSIRSSSSGSAYPLRTLAAGAPDASMPVRPPLADITRATAAAPARDSLACRPATTAAACMPLRPAGPPPAPLGTHDAARPLSSITGELSLLPRSQFGGHGPPQAVSAPMPRADPPSSVSSSNGGGGGGSGGGAEEDESSAWNEFF